MKSGRAKALFLHWSLFNCKLNRGGSHLRLRCGLDTERQHILAVEILQRAECLFGSHSFVSLSHVITSQQSFLLGRNGNGIQIDRRVHRNTCDVSRNFPNSSLPTTNSCSSHKTMSHRDGSKRQGCVTPAPFYLVFKGAGKYDRDVPIFPTSECASPFRQKYAL